MNDQLLFSLFRGVHDTQPRPVTLDELVQAMRTDQSVRDLTDKHRYALSVGDKQGAKRFKNMMLSYGMAAQFEGGRRYEHITAYTGVSMADMDDVPPARMAEALALLRADEHTLLAYVTIGGSGLRVLFRYQLEGDTYSPSTSEGKEQYKQVFLHGNAYYEALTGLPTDPQCKNPNRISTIAYDENLYYNPDAVPFVIKTGEKRPVGRPKRVKREEGKAKSDNADEAPLQALAAAAKVIAKVEAQGIRYEEGTYNKYVCSACYEMNRYGVPEEQCREWAAKWFADYDTSDVEAIVRSCYRQADDHGDYLKPKRSRKKSESSVGDVRDIRDYLTSHEVKTRYNVITRKYEIYNEDTDTWCEKTDRMENTLYCRITEEIGKRILKSDLHQLLGSEFSPEFNPFADYLTTLPPIPDDDDTDYIDLVASMVHVATGNNRRFLTDLTGNRRWLPFFVTDIDSPYTHAIPHDRLYAQAYALYREGFRYWFSFIDTAFLPDTMKEKYKGIIEEKLRLLM